MCVKKNIKQEDLRPEEIEEVLGNVITTEEQEETLETDQQFLLECLNFVLAKYEEGRTIAMEEWQEMEDQRKIGMFIWAHSNREVVKKDNVDTETAPDVLERMFDLMLALLYQD